MAGITRDHIAASMSWTEYRALVRRFAEEDRTSGPRQTKALRENTRVNERRMSRIEAAFVVSPRMHEALARLHRPLLWVLFAETWCGDVAQNAPAIAAIAAASPMIDLRVLLRDEHPDAMDCYLTNGGRAIPKLVCLRAETLEELGSWGARPGPAQRLVHNARRDDVVGVEWIAALHRWYGQDACATLERELLALLRSWMGSEE